MPSQAKWSVAVGDESTSVICDLVPNADRAPVFVFAHGAGGHMADRGMQQTAEALVARGLNVVRFNFLYKEKGSGRPDPMPLLKATTSAVVARVRQELQAETLIIGGRSMGGRAASMLAAEGYDCAGLLLLAYPLHPAGRPDQLRDAHLPAIRVPVLSFNGTRDSMCTRELMEKALQRVTAPWQMHWVEGADHGFHVLRSSGRTDADVVNEVADVSAAWVAALSHARRA